MDGTPRDRIPAVPGQRNAVLFLVRDRVKGKRYSDLMLYRGGFLAVVVPPAIVSATGGDERWLAGPEANSEGVWAWRRLRLLAAARRRGTALPWPPDVEQPRMAAEAVKYAKRGWPHAEGAAWGYVARFLFRRLGLPATGQRVYVWPGP